MRVLQLVKSADGAGWAAVQAHELLALGVEVHVAVPSAEGRTVKLWRSGGAAVHISPTDVPVKRPWRAAETVSDLRGLAERLRPDLVHSHFFSSTIIMRRALGKLGRIPRVFQVPGPLHLESRLWREIEVGCAGPQDHWIASSRCIEGHYRKGGIGRDWLFLSYYGGRIPEALPVRTGMLRRRLGIADDVKVVGNANFIYPPKWFLGQTRGLKAHEDVIDALGKVLQERADVVGVLIGGTFAGPSWYERSLRRRAARVGKGRIIMTGYMPHDEIMAAWPDFDVAVHIPTSENCGGVVEPLLAGVPTIAGRVGGLPEVVMDGLTGRVVEVRDPVGTADAVLEVLGDLEHYRGLAANGQRLVRRMFDVKRTAAEVYQIYRHILDPSCPRPAEFDSRAFLRQEAVEGRLAGIG